MRQIRLILAVVFAVLIVVVALQNTESVDTRLLFATVTMPRAVLLFTAMALGFGSGVLASLYWLRSSSPSKES